MRPRKAPTGLTKVLFVRVDRPFMDRLSELHEHYVRTTGFTLSQSDVVRKIIDDAYSALLRPRPAAHDG